MIRGPLSLSGPVLLFSTSRALTGDAENWTTVKRQRDAPEIGKGLRASERERFWFHARGDERTREKTPRGGSEILRIVSPLDRTVARIVERERESGLIGPGEIEMARGERQGESGQCRMGAKFSVDERG